MHSKSFQSQNPSARSARFVVTDIDTTYRLHHAGGLNDYCNADTVSSVVSTESAGRSAPGDVWIDAIAVIERERTDRAIDQNRQEIISTHRPGSLHYSRYLQPSADRESVLNIGSVPGYQIDLAPACESPSPLQHEFTTKLGEAWWVADIVGMEAHRLVFQ